VGFALRTELGFSRPARRAMLVAAIALASASIVAPRAASAEGLFDFFFGGAQKQQQRQAPAQANFFADPSSQNSPPGPPPRPVASSGGSGPAFCVRSCDGRYFPLSRANASPVQMCQAFCPASPTKVFYGSNIDSATSASGERYADSENAFAYRKALRADCTCNGRDAAGLAPVDLTLDSSLRSGDVIATTDGLVAYSGIKVGNNQAPEFTPVASYPGLTAEVRARLGEMKVAPVNAEMISEDVPGTDSSRPTPSVTSVPKSAAIKDKRADAN
jgi:uncharacterized protein DUF2865